MKKLDWTERYNKNSEVVRKIGKKLGFELNGYNPDWLVWLYSGSSIDIKDEVMGMLAKLCGEDWEFDLSEEKILNNIESIDWNMEIHAKAIKEIAVIGDGGIWKDGEFKGMQKDYKIATQERKKRKKRFKKLLKARQWLEKRSIKIK